MGYGDPAAVSVAIKHAKASTSTNERFNAALDWLVQREEKRTRTRPQLHMLSRWCLREALVQSLNSFMYARCSFRCFLLVKWDFFFFFRF